MSLFSADRWWSPKGSRQREKSAGTSFSARPRATIAFEPLEDRVLLSGSLGSDQDLLSTLATDVAPLSTTDPGHPESPTEDTSSVPVGPLPLTGPVVVLGGSDHDDTSALEDDEPAPVGPFNEQELGEMARALAALNPPASPPRSDPTAAPATVPNTPKLTGTGPAAPLQAPAPHVTNLIALPAPAVPSGPAMTPAAPIHNALPAPGADGPNAAPAERSDRVVSQASGPESGPSSETVMTHADGPSTALNTPETGPVLTGSTTRQTTSADDAGSVWRSLSSLAPAVVQTRADDLSDASLTGTGGLASLLLAGPLDRPATLSQALMPRAPPANQDDRDNPGDAPRIEQNDTQQDDPGVDNPRLVSRQYSGSLTPFTASLLGGSVTSARA